MLRASLWPLRLVLLLLAASGLTFCVLPQYGQNNVAASDRPSDTTTYTPDGRLQPLMHYREWIYLTTGLDMSYTPQSGAAGHSIFDNVFVNPSSYQFFQRTGTWPDGTTLVLEKRRGETGVSINRHGQTQSAELMGVEVHVKDARLPGVATSSTPPWIPPSCSSIPRCWSWRNRSTR
jgi:hypothetical protein